MKIAIWAAGLLVFASSAMGAEIRTRFGPAKTSSEGSRSAPQAVSAPAARESAVSRSSSGRASYFRSSGRASSFGQFQTRRMSSRRAADPETPGAPAPQAGALVQSWHPTKVGPETPQVLHVVDGGSDFMRPESDKTQALTSARGVRMGKADTPPSSGSGGASGKNAVTAIPNPGEE